MKKWLFVLAILAILVAPIFADRIRNVELEPDQSVPTNVYYLDLSNNSITVIDLDNNEIVIIREVGLNEYFVLRTGMFVNPDIQPDLQNLAQE